MYWPDNNMIGLSILHINKQDRQIILHTNSVKTSLHYLYFTPIYKLKYFMNLRDKDNLRRKDTYSETSEERTLWNGTFVLSSEVVLISEVHEIF